MSAEKDSPYEKNCQADGPYCYRYGDYTVKIAFADTEVSLEERMLAYIRAKCTPS